MYLWDTKLLYHSLIRLGKQYLTINTTILSNDTNHITTVPTIIPIEQRRPPTDLEQEIVWKYKREGYNISTIQPLLNPVFLFDLNQLSSSSTTSHMFDETNETIRMARQERMKQLRYDMKQFLQLQHDLPDLVHYKPGRQYNDEQIQNEINQYKINICHSQHDTVRKELLHVAQQTSEWIRTVFINAPTVHVSSRDYFIRLLESYMIDPCTIYNSTKYFVVE
jgi:hypothetical protein